MAGTFEALDDFLNDGITLPVRGKDGRIREYHIADPSAEAGLRIDRITTLVAQLSAGMAAPEQPVLDDDEERDLYRLCLGESYQQLKADLSWSMFKHVALTVMMWISSDEDTALEYWKTGEAPGKAGRNRAERRQTLRASSAKGAANGTRSPVSTSGTKAASQRRSKGGNGKARRST